MIVKDKKAAAKEKIQTVIHKLHNEDLLVHGDLRATNILVSGMENVYIQVGVVLNYGTGTGVYLIDFDWSGPETSDYPFFMNPEITWPAGVQDGGKLAFSHDNEWISRGFL